MNVHNITRPTLLIDSEKCKSNIHRMAQKAKSKRLQFRPHFKTHHSAEISVWIRAEGVDRCTVSSVKMAEYFVSHGWNDILIAFPVNVLEAKKIQLLASQIKLQVLVYSTETLHLLAEKTKAPIGIKIELDLGSNRSGLTIEDHDHIDQILKLIQEVPHFQFTGFYSHPGHTYTARSIEEVKKMYAKLIVDLNTLKSRYGKIDGFSITIGDTPGCTIVDEFGPIEEISPGNFVFYDVMQVNIGSCTFDDIAVVMVCPVVGKNFSRKEILIHGGAVHFSKEVLQDVHGKTHFGKLALPSKNKWTGVIPGCYLKSISQEHGLIHCSDDLLDETQIGDVVYIYPAHSCLSADLMKSYLTTNDVLMQGETAFMP